MTSSIFPSVKDKAVVITGGASGIGAAMVRAFVNQGARVWFFDFDVPSGKALVHELEEAAHVPRFLSCDLRDIAQVQSLLEGVGVEAGTVDTLINNAANDDRHDIETVDQAYWDDRAAVNLRHYFFCAQSVVPGMKKAGGGVIINLGSISWHLGLPNLIAYQTAKAGIEGLTRGLAQDLGPFGIRSVCLIPGAVKTPRQMELWTTPEEEAKILSEQCLKARIEPEDVASFALFLASDGAKMCTGQNYLVDAGWR